MRLTLIPLHNVFGAGFPACTEIDHLLALRGYLILLLKEQQSAGRSEMATANLREAVKEVSDRLEHGLGVNLLARPQAPRELFEFYYHNVSTVWKDLAALR